MLEDAVEDAGFKEFLDDVVVITRLCALVLRSDHFAGNFIRPLEILGKYVCEFHEEAQEVGYRCRPEVASPVRTRDETAWNGKLAGRRVEVAPSRRGASARHGVAL